MLDKNKQVCFLPHSRSKNKLRILRKKRIRVKGSVVIPRVVVYRSNKNLFLQAIDDEKGITLASSSTLKETQQKLAEFLAKNLKSKKIKKIVFDRAGYKYHGKVKKIADDLRVSGLEF